MVRTGILFVIMLGLFQQAAAQSAHKKIYYVDSIFIQHLSAEDNVLYKEDIAEQRLITHPDSVSTMGMDAGDTIIYIITKAYLELSDSVRAIPTVYTMADKNGLLYYSDTSAVPYSGPFREYYLNGALKTRGEIQEGYISGYVTDYYRNGTLKSSRYFSRNTEDGIREEYYLNGSIQRRGNVANGYMQGFWQEWHSTGRLKKEIRYLNSQPFYEEEGESVFYRLVESIRTLLHAGNYKEALTHIRECKTAKPDMEELYYYSGIAYQGLQQFPEAIKSFTEALKIEPLYTNALKERAIVSSILLDTLPAGATERNDLRLLLCNDIKEAVQLGVSRAAFQTLRQRYCLEENPEPVESLHSDSK
ncbi:tetratricopeptide repeat protein [Filimonas effusa]|uniref:Tetratricopeptide repeat protein n=1 Tax=Filimonas effusa TaxID=2508721 RepID=A0A4Q1D800_9BACT|nr:tetratricopeptide repeat protein [Filimonas effusa]RXK85434.1 tetratricopeptide repeat protein [Filimonas effusa]